IKKKIQEVNSFLADHKDMVLYLELGNENLDPQYFLRKNRELFAHPMRYRSSFDPDFSSARDGQLAHIFGYQGYQGYLNNKLGILPKLDSDLSIQIPPINWTGSKVALTELGFALFYSGAIDHGNASLK